MTQFREVLNSYNSLHLGQKKVLLREIARKLYENTGNVILNREYFIFMGLYNCERAGIPVSNILSDSLLVNEEALRRALLDSIAESRIIYENIRPSSGSVIISGVAAGLGVMGLSSGTAYLIQNRKDLSNIYRNGIANFNTKRNAQ